MAKKNNTNSPTEFEQELTMASQGTKSVLGSVSALVVDGVSYTPAQIGAKLDAWAALYSGVRNLRAQWAEAMSARKAAAPDARTFLRQLKAAVEAALGEQSSQLEAFGWKPRKSAKKLTTEEQAAKVTKARETRAKDHPAAPPSTGGAGTK
jgi:hypothetical protein